MRYILSLLLLAVCQDSRVADKSSENQNGMTYAVKNVHVSINKTADEVYQFASQPENFPKWVKLFQSMSKQDDHWIGKTAQGDVTIKWAPPNNFYILDHHVIFPNGETVFNAMRIVPNNKGCEFVFTLFQRPGRTEADFEEDAGLVKADLETLKRIMEGGGL